MSCSSIGRKGNVDGENCCQLGQTVLGKYYAFARSLCGSSECRWDIECLPKVKVNERCSIVAANRLSCKDRRERLKSGMAVV